jgi:hypothetical protein
MFLNRCFFFLVVVVMDVQVLERFNDNDKHET